MRSVITDQLYCLKHVLDMGILRTVDPLNALVQS
jgi:hypothetical protein